MGKSQGDSCETYQVLCVLPHGVTLNPKRKGYPHHNKSDAGESPEKGGCEPLFFARRAGYSKYSCTDLASMDSCCMVPMALTMDSAPAMVVV